MTAKACINEYTRIMKSVDTSSAVKTRIINNCTAVTPSTPIQAKAAIAAISGAAVVAAALGIRKYRSTKSRT